MELIDDEGAKGELVENKASAVRKLREFLALMFTLKGHRGSLTLESFSDEDKFDELSQAQV